MSELLRLPIKDIDLALNNVYIFDSKSQRDRIVPLLYKVKEDLKIHLTYVEKTHKTDLQEGLGAIQDLLGHNSLQTTMIYTHVVKSLSKQQLISPLDL